MASSVSLRHPPGTFRLACEEIRIAGQSRREECAREAFGFVPEMRRFWVDSGRGRWASGEDIGMDGKGMAG